MVRRILLAAMTTVVALALTGAPASAQDKVRGDAVGDGSAHADITSVRVRNTATTLVVSTRFATVRRGHTTGTVALSAARFRGYYAVRSVPVSGGRHRNTLTRENPPQDVFDEAVPCPGLRVSWTRGSGGRMRVVVPWSCLDAPPGRVGVDAEAIDKQGPKGAISSLRGDEPVDGAGPDGDVVVDRLDRTVVIRRG